MADHNDHHQNAQTDVARSEDSPTLLPLFILGLALIVIGMIVVMALT